MNNALTPTYDFELHGLGLVAQEHADAMLDGLVPRTIVRENEGKVDGLGRDIEMEIPVVARVFDFMRARRRVDESLLLIRNLEAALVGAGTKAKSNVP